MTDKKKMDRRSFLGRVVGAATAAGALGTVTGRANAQDYSGLTDSDSSDAPNYGTLTGYSDSDTGAGADPSSRGRRRAVSAACSDSDTGKVADPIGQGRRCAVNTETKAAPCTDSDSGSGADASGSGRRCGAAPSPCSDSDTGRTGDPLGQGRRCSGN